MRESEMADMGHGADGLHSTVAIGASPLVYWRRGLPQADTLVMLHGLGSDHTGLLDVAARLAGKQVIVPDLPAFGHSAPLPARHTLRRYVTVVDGLRRHLGLKRFALLGHSLGADIALAYAGTFPAAVTDLCLVNPVLCTDGLAVRLAELYCQVGAAVPRSLSRALLSSRAAVYLQDRAMLTTPDAPTRRRILELDYITARLADPRAISESVRSVREAPFERYAERVRARTLVVTGARDKLATPRSVTRLPWQPPHPELTVVAGAGHLLPAERPAQVAAIVEQFLDVSSTGRGRAGRRHDHVTGPSASGTGQA
jgi:pimeloyl-ACP methyl ester carboxylesterase